MAQQRKWLGLSKKSRTQTRIDNNLGIISAGSSQGTLPRYRSEELYRYERYLESKQYDGMPEWNECGADGSYIPMRSRKPRIIYNFGKFLVDKVASKLVGDSVFPTFNVEDSPDDTAFIQAIVKASRMKPMALDIVKEMLGQGSGLLRFYLVGNVIKMETYKSCYCYPEFDETGQLSSVEVRYVYEDASQLDASGKPIEKWYRMILTKTSDILYDSPLATDKNPIFTEVSRADHNLGFVQATWFRASDDKHSPDGFSLICDILDFIDSINYGLSQGDQAVAYAQEPQLAISGMDVDEIDNLIKSSTKAWNLGREGKANFIESDLNGIQRGMELRDKIKQSLSEVARVVILDPEKIVGSAQSAKAMEVLHGPLVELVNELRPWVEQGLVEALTKIAVISLVQSKVSPEFAPITMPPGYAPQSLDIAVTWPPIFPMTMEDLRAKVSIAVQVANASLFSRETMTRWLAKDFGIEDVDAEIAKVAAQPVLNPFGAF